MVTFVSGIIRVAILVTVTLVGVTVVSEIVVPTKDVE